MVYRENDKPGGPRVGIDCRSLGNGPSGVATYVNNLRKCIPDLDCVFGRFPANNFLWNNVRVPLTRLTRNWDLFHAPSYTCPLVNFCPVILSVHDVAYLVHHEWYPYQLDRWRLRYYTSSIKVAERIIVPSNFSQQEVLKIFPELKGRVVHIPLGVSSDFYPDPEGARSVRERFGLPDRYLLNVGDIHARRNLDVVSRAAETLGIPLVLVGRILRGGEAYESWPLRFSSISLAELRGIYSGARALVYPSLYEGFGLPLLEAMACGTAVVAARRASIPEVCGDAAVLVEPEVEAFVEAIRLVLEEHSKWSDRGRRRAADFGWQKAADLTRELYKTVYDDLCSRGDVPN